jgi:long-chain fatty acid transport protein
MEREKDGRGGKLKTGAYAATLALIVLVTSAFGAGFETHEQGAKAVAMGGAFTAQADDPSAVFYNPAGITQLEGVQASLGVSLIRPNVKFKSYGNPAMGTFPGQTWEIKDRNWFIPNVYATYKLSKYFSLGLGGFSDFGLGIEWPSTFEGRFSPGARKTLLTTYSFSPVIAVKPIEWLSFGVGPILQRLDIDLKNLVFIAPPAAPFTPGRNLAQTAGSKLKGFDWALGYNIGLLLDLPMDFHFGASYLGRVRHKIEDGHEELIFANGLTRRLGASSTITLPSSAKFGLAWKRDPWTFEVDAQWIEWSAYKKLEVNFSSGTSLVAPKNWRDSWSWQLGAQYRLSKYFDLRAGFRYEESPIPSHTLDPIVPSGHREVYCVGVGSHFGRLTIDLAYNYIQDQDRKWNSLAGFVNLGPVTLTRVTGKFIDGNAHVISANIGYKF